jgi:hypothetical protein
MKPQGGRKAFLLRTAGLAGGVGLTVDDEAENPVGTAEPLVGEDLLVHP